MTQTNSFNTETTLTVNDKQYRYHSLATLQNANIGDVNRLPFSLRILLENLLRQEDGVTVSKGDIEALVKWDAKAAPDKEIFFMPARVLLQDFTGVPAVADLAAMRAAVARLGGDPQKINPFTPADLVIDHSVQVDSFGSSDSFRINAEHELERNRERYKFLRWGQNALNNFRVVPPDNGIVHQINLEHLAPVAMTAERNGATWVYPDTLIGTDSHSTMINGLGVLGWGVGGIEAEAALLGQPCSLLIPQVVGFRLEGAPVAGVTATDIVLTITQKLRAHGVVGQFVEFYGPGLAHLSLADRATIANMAPEYGATCGLFPIDEKTTEYMQLSGRGDNVALVEAYYKAQGMWHSPEQASPDYSAELSFDLGSVEACLAGPSRPQDRVPLSHIRESFREALITQLQQKDDTVDQAAASQWQSDHGQQMMTSPELATDVAASKHAFETSVPVTQDNGEAYNLGHGSVVIASITSCTNTSNPGVMMAAGLLARNAVKRGLRSKPWVKTSLAPGSRVVTDYLNDAGLMAPLEALNFHLVGYGCTTCIGNSGPLPTHITEAINSGDLAVGAVLSGNRNFEGRVNAHVRANYLASPPLVVAYALAGNLNLDLSRDPLGTDESGEPVYLKDIWPTQEEIADVVQKHVGAEQFKRSYADIFKGDKEWNALDVPEGDLFQWQDDSTYIKEPPFFNDLTPTPAPLTDIRGARVLAMLGDSVTTDHISPAGSIAAGSPAANYLIEQGVAQKDFNSYGSRRGNHEVMVRGTFANIRLRNRLAPGTEGGVTRHLPEGSAMSIYDAAAKYQAAGIPLMVLAGKEYGTGSSRDWAAKGPKLLGINAVIAESFERIHRSNLVGMGILPMQFNAGDSAASLGLTGEETFAIAGLNDLTPGQMIDVVATAADGSSKTFAVLVRIDTANEIEYFRHGGILSYVLRQTIAAS
ncbi:MAG: aconitate hydratase AcnA [Thiotrichaceae bacterium]|nr:aconitate hydratase AcnA [Thiotrichaceae bacterium]PCI14517.1 MAG: aconitate hydratase AcnA [Thiotrichales bacterium]